MQNVILRNDVSTEVWLFYTMFGKRAYIAVDWYETSHLSVVHMCSAMRMF
jgi:hypothetical protein